MSGTTTLLVPSSARLVTLDDRPSAGPAAWPNKNADDIKDFWIDCSGALASLGGIAAVSIGAVALTLVAGDASLQQYGPLIKQLGAICVFLCNGTPSLAYQLLATVQIVSLTGGPTRTYTKVIMLTMSDQPAYGSPLVGVQAQLLLDGADISAALITSTNSTPQQLTAGAWVNQIGSGGGSDDGALALAQAVEGGAVTGTDTLLLTGTTSATAALLAQNMTIVTGGAGGVRYPSGLIGNKLTWVNISGATGNFYPPSGTNWRTLATDVPIQVPDQTESTGYVSATGIAIAF